MEVLSLGLGAKNLPSVDKLSKSDPFIVIFKVLFVVEYLHSWYVQETPSGAFHFLKRTEVKKDDLNPVWEDIKITEKELSINSAEQVVLRWGDQRR